MGKLENLADNITRKTDKIINLSIASIQVVLNQIAREIKPDIVKMILTNYSKSGIGDTGKIRNAIINLTVEIQIVRGNPVIKIKSSSSTGKYSDGSLVNIVFGVQNYGAVINHGGNKLTGATKRTIKDLQAGNNVSRTRKRNAEIATSGSSYTVIPGKHFFKLTQTQTQKINSLFSVKMNEKLAKLMK